MYTVWCEWDIGVEGKVFATKQVAIKHAKLKLQHSGIEETFDELCEEALIGLNDVEVIFE